MNWETNEVGGRLWETREESDTTLAGHADD